VAAEIPTDVVVVAVALGGCAVVGFADANQLVLYYCCH
jgi:hypothetical protein